MRIYYKKSRVTVFILITLSASVISAKAQVKILTKRLNNVDGFTLTNETTASTIYYDKEDAQVVAESAKLFAKDIGMVSGATPLVSTSREINRATAVIVGTLGSNKLIDDLVKSGKINANFIKNGWEQFIIQTIKNPFPKVKQALVVVGSDRRGTAYGIFTISKAIGVSPWYWWADVPVVKMPHIKLAPI